MQTTSRRSFLAAASSALVAPALPRAAPASRPAAATLRGGDGILLSRAVIAMRCVQKIGERIADVYTANESLCCEAASAEVVAGHILDTYLPLVPAARDRDADVTRLLDSPFRGDPVACVPEARNLRQAVEGAYHVVLVVAVKTLDDIWSAHDDCPDRGCVVCKQIFGFVSILELLRDVQSDPVYFIDRHVFGARTPLEAGKAAMQMSPDQLETILLHYSRIALEVKKP